MNWKVTKLVEMQIAFWLDIPNLAEFLNTEKNGTKR